uniref:PS II complex 12 kDa extrinsic protein n=1 Tax=Eucampia antarctica TaxID=49252 RepID=A0A7S2WR82_9STRA|mmetsp:Transcript_9895/g.9586  ORF Transcript_9895/g.9586 Transcript_9895/m.9586 type:complete len:139 (+) Transcript_9895:46-462(+)|eukprot:CAMPEP_0197834350 /NCGR_PEP_ID=MMETSP1437-20131217/22083_1 /TAXON_ID=49252 ORGANISM="Eucampia antarctica, Strain CCMP1452" /NCGR_SAMPLE_ID=MMETSP1437 /ASSEMBLY_ACC=CAM_ASM_001096 /LENGTH=138 /DNA_ID=CAMNT_0043438955 /DNA_START=114 /DNA_END=530 /DNA_ORIENTATION=+
MKLSIVAILATIGSTAAFAPSTTSSRASVQLDAETQSRKAFLGVAAAAVFAGVPAIANAGTMVQENVSAPTEVWETGKPSAVAAKARVDRFANARTQMTSSFPPIKRTNLERKSPVTRLDINAPNFTKYKTDYPGLYK